MKEIIKIVKSFEDSSVLPEGVSETIQNWAQEPRGGFLIMLLGILGASLIGNTLTGSGILRTGEGIVRAGYGSKIKDNRYKIDF